MRGADDGLVWNVGYCVRASRSCGVVVMFENGFGGKTGHQAGWPNVVVGAWQSATRAEIRCFAMWFQRDSCVTWINLDSLPEPRLDQIRSLWLCGESRPLPFCSVASVTLATTLRYCSSSPTDRRYQDLPTAFADFHAGKADSAVGMSR